MNPIHFIPFLLLFITCNNKPIQTPSEDGKNDFMQRSRQLEKERQNSEAKLLYNWNKKHPEFKLQDTISGIYFNEFVKGNEKKIKDLDYIEYRIAYQNLNLDTIYTMDETGLKKLIVSKTHETRGVESVLKLMSENGKAHALLPSFMAYGLYGDENKIGANVPVFVTVHLEKITSYKSK